MLKDFETGYERKGFVWKIDLVCGHQEDFKTRPEGGLRAEFLQSHMFHINADNLVETWCDSFCDKSVPAPDIQVPLHLRTRLDGADAT